MRSIRPGHGAAATAGAATSAVDPGLVRARQRQQGVGHVVAAGDRAARREVDRRARRARNDVVPSGRSATSTAPARSASAPSVADGDGVRAPRRGQPAAPLVVDDDDRRGAARASNSRALAAK